MGGARLPGLLRGQDLPTYFSLMDTPRDTFWMAVSYDRPVTILRRNVLVVDARVVARVVTVEGWAILRQRSHLASPWEVCNTTR